MHTPRLLNPGLHTGVLEMMGVCFLWRPLWLIESSGSLLPGQPFVLHPLPKIERHQVTLIKRWGINFVQSLGTRMAPRTGSSYERTCDCTFCSAWTAFGWHNVYGRRQYYISGEFLLYFLMYSFLWHPHRAGGKSQISADSLMLFQTDFLERSPNFADVTQHSRRGWRDVDRCLFNLMRVPIGNGRWGGGPSYHA